jgi:hypothetical protein
MAGFRKAKGEQAAIKEGLYGPSGSGKTFTALLIAEGLAKLTGKRIAYVDTERGTDFYAQDVPTRSIHPDAFDFDALYTKSLTEATAAVRGLDPEKYSVVVVDSITHLWEAARAAYEGRMTKAGTIPMQGWGQVKKPYKELITLLMGSPFHVIICGRQGIEYGEDEETGELKALGKKMKAEGETPYEPHILMRMEAVKQRTGQAIITAFAEKDRTGVLAGQTISWPNFDNMVKPILPLLGLKQAAVPTEDETASQDAEALAVSDLEREAKSADLLQELSAQVDLCRSAEDLKVMGKKITPEIKKQMLPAHVTRLRERYMEAERRISGRRSLEPEAGD